MNQQNETGFAHWLRKNWILAAIFVVVLIGVLAYFGARSATQAKAGPYSGQSTVGSAAPGSSDPYADIKKDVLNFYRSNYKDNSPNVSVDVQNYGCHMGVSIVKDGKVIKTLAYFGPGQIFDLNE